MTRLKGWQVLPYFIHWIHWVRGSGISVKATNGNRWKSLDEMWVRPLGVIGLKYSLGELCWVVVYSVRE